jgi:hypothetical protein
MDYPNSQFYQDANPARKNGESGRDCDALRILIPAYSVGATGPEETQWVEALLERCPEAVGELEAYNMLAESLLFSAPSATPPPTCEKSCCDP